MIVLTYDIWVILFMHGLWYIAVPWMVMGYLVWIFLHVIEEQSPYYYGRWFFFSPIICVLILKILAKYFFASDRQSTKEEE